MVRGERKEPIWQRIPVASQVTARRTSTRAQRLEAMAKKEKEEVEMQKLKKDQEEAAKILTKMWKKEEEGKQRARRRHDGEGDGDTDEDYERRGGRRPGRGRRDEEQDFDDPYSDEEDRHPRPRDVYAVAEDDQRRRERRGEPTRGAARGGLGGRGTAAPDSRRSDDFAEERSRRDSLAASGQPRRFRESANDIVAAAADEDQDTRFALRIGDARSDGSAREAEAVPKPPGPPASGSSSGGSWQQTVGGSASSHATGAPEAAGAKTPAPSRGTKRSSKIAGVFGLSDSDSEREKGRRERELAAKRKAPPPGAAAATKSLPGDQSRGPPGPLLIDGRPLSPAEVHMRYAQFKQKCNRKWVPMPEDLRRAVEQVMGKVPH